MQATTLSNDKINRDEWDALIRQSPQGMFYALTGFMDIVAPHWAGYNLKQRFTYLLDIRPDEEELLKGFEENLRQLLRKNPDDDSNINLNAEPALLANLIRENRRE